LVFLDRAEDVFLTPLLTFGAGVAFSATAGALAGRAVFTAAAAAAAFAFLRRLICGATILLVLLYILF
jgi:hypothetical protein